MRKGFTLLEIIMVIAILGVLSAFFVPKYVSSLRRGKDVQCKATRLNVQKADEQYYYNNNNQLAPDFDTLYAKGYLDKRPRCYQGGVYVWSAPALPRYIICSIHGYSLSVSTAAH